MQDRICTRPLVQIANVVAGQATLYYATRGQMPELDTECYAWMQRAFRGQSIDISSTPYVY